MASARSSSRNLSQSSSSLPSSQGSKSIRIIVSPLQNRKERILTQGHPSHLLHPLFALLLLIEEFIFARDVATVQVARDIFAVGRDRFTRDHFAANGSLNGNLKLFFG